MIITSHNVCPQCCVCMDYKYCGYCRSKLYNKHIFVPMQIWEIILLYLDKNYYRTYVRTIRSLSLTCSELFKFIYHRKSNILKLIYSKCVNLDSVNNFYDLHKSEDIFKSAQYIDFLHLYRSFFSKINKISNSVSRTTTENKFVFKNKGIIFFSYNNVINIGQPTNDFFYELEYELVENIHKHHKSGILFTCNKEKIFNTFISISKKLNISFDTMMEYIDQGKIYYRACEYKLCKNCYQRIYYPDSINYIKHDGRILCEVCKNKCLVCDELVKKYKKSTKYQEKFGERRICDECFSKHYDICFICNRIVEKYKISSEYQQIFCERRICDTCFSKCYDKCFICNQIVKKYYISFKYHQIFGEKFFCGYDEKKQLFRNNKKNCMVKALNTVLKP